MGKTLSETTGTLKISNDVVMRIAELAAVEIPGVVSEKKKLAVKDHPSRMTRRFRSPVKVRLAKEAAVIDIGIIVQQGYKAIQVAEAVQESVKNAVQSMTGIAVSKVNVNVVAIKLSTKEPAAE